MPSVIVLTNASANLSDPKFRLAFAALKGTRTASEPERILRRGASAFRVHVDNTGASPPAVLLPLDKLFEIRAAATIRLWRSLCDRNPGPNPAALSPQRRARLILALRALDARLEKTSYRKIAEAFFALKPISAADWQSHELRDQTIRLARLGHDLMNGGYRNLLLHPYRRRT